MWFVYIVVCEDESLYTGIATDPKARLRTHQNGKGGSYTRSHKPVKIVYTEKVPTKSAALKRELEIKSWDRKTKIESLNLTI